MCTICTRIFKLLFFFHVAKKKHKQIQCCLRDWLHNIKECFWLALAQLKSCRLTLDVTSHTMKIFSFTYVNAMDYMHACAMSIHTNDIPLLPCQIKTSMFIFGPPTEAEITAGSKNASPTNCTKFGTKSQDTQSRKSWFIHFGWESKQKIHSQLNDKFYSIQCILSARFDSFFFYFRFYFHSDFFNTFFLVKFVAFILNVWLMNTFNAFRFAF